MRGLPRPVWGQALGELPKPPLVCFTVQYSTLHYITLHYSTLHYITVRHNVTIVITSMLPLPLPLPLVQDCTELLAAPKLSAPT